jgi:hypothetical protein
LSGVNYPKKNIKQINERDNSSFGGMSNGTNDNLSTNGAIPMIKNVPKMTYAVSSGSVNAPQIIGNTTKATKFVKIHNVKTTSTIVTDQYDRSTK